MSRADRISLPALLLLVGTGVAGCATTPIGTLSGVIRDGRAAQGAELRDVSVVREGDPITLSIGMPVQKGDTILTGPASQVVLIFQDDWEVVVDPNTSLYVENPSTWLERGKVFVKKLVERAKEAFKVQDEHTTFSAEATEFVVTSDGEGLHTLAVVEGRVAVESRTGRFARAVYLPGQQGRVEGDSVLSRMADLTAAETAEIRRVFALADRVTTVSVPDLSGLAREEAERQLQASGLRVGDVDTRITGEGAPGTVVAQTPRTGPLRAGETVDLVIEAPSTVVPDVVGLTRDQAEDALDNAELDVRVRERDDPDYQPGTVIEQSRAEGERVTPGTRVTLTVAVDRTTVPDLSQATLERARRLLDRAGLRVGRVQERETLDAQAGMVMRQSPAAGSRVSRDTRVDLTVAVEPPFCVVPDLTGLTDAQAVGRLTEAGFRVGSRTTQGDMDFDKVWGQTPEPQTQTRCRTAVDLVFGRLG